MTDDLIDMMLRATGTREILGVRTEAGSFWDAAAPSRPDPVLHAVLDGSTLVALPGCGIHKLHAGDLLWVPARTPLHFGPDLGGAPHSCAPASARRSARDGSTMHLGHGHTTVRLLSLQYRHEATHPTARLELQQHPVLVRSHEDPGLLTTARSLDEELAQRRIGAAASATALLDLLLVRLLREAIPSRCIHADTDRELSRPDPLVQCGLAIINDRPDRDWTTTALADALHVSRSTLHRHFMATIGATPRAYLTERRLSTAALRLRDSDETIDRIAAAVGYESAHAFSRAFRRALDESPSRYRRRTRS